ncbi:MAG: SagB/ThcOx family dehydrogenase [Actinomycetota bacterium]|nr:SagB/ThcOx family dehydrogenase [Actinomycetota bacterium]
MPTVQFASFAYGSSRSAEDAAEDYHEAAKLYPSFAARQLALSASPTLADSMRRSSRRHPHRPRVQLPLAPPSDARLDEMLSSRRSRAPQPGSQLELVDIATLASAYESDPATGLRAVPSGGALYPLELYLLANRISGVEAGTYHLDPFDRALELLASGRPDLGGVFVDASIADNAAAIAVLTGVFCRSRCKYGLRGYRFALLEAGHVMQAIALLATAIGVDALPLGGFYDARLDRLVRANGVDESVLYAVALGRHPA